MFFRNQGESIMHLSSASASAPASVPSEAQAAPAPAYRRGAALLSRNWGWLLFRGVLSLLLGGIAMLFPVNAVLAFTLVFAAWAGADGILSIIAALRGATHHEERWGLLALRGLSGIAVAILFAAMPGIATLSYAMVGVMLVAAWAMLAGLLEIAAAIRLRREIAGEWLLGLSGLLSVLLGAAIWAMVFAYPGSSLLSAGWLIAGYALFGGVVLIGLALRVRRLQHPAG